MSARRTPWALGLMLLAALAALPNAAAAPNLIQNGTFESGTLVGWAANGATASSESAHEGAFAARTTNQTMETVVATIPGQEYKLVGWVRIGSDVGSDWGGYRVTAVSWNWVDLATTGFLVASERGYAWFKIGLTFTAATDQTRIQVGYFGGGGRQMVCYADDLRVYAKGENMPPEFEPVITPTRFAALPAMMDFSITGDDPDGAIVRVDWDFGDGVASQTSGGSRRIGVPGTFTATVRVADDEGAVVTKTIAWSASDASFPSLSIEEPSAIESIVREPVLELRGTSAGASDVAVSSDRSAFVVATGAANWSAGLPLAPGWNRVLVQARGPSGRIVTEERRVRYVPQDALAIEEVRASAAVVAAFEPIEVRFRVRGSAATHRDFPYEPAPPPGVTFVDGVSADVTFVGPGGSAVMVRPAFFLQPYARAEKSGMEWMYPSGAARWVARFAPPVAGTWTYSIRIQEARGEVTTSGGAFTVVAGRDPRRHGPIGVATTDGRYFEHADGTPFLGVGHAFGVSPEGYSIEAERSFETMGSANQNFLRFWIAGHVWGSAWQPWASRTLGYDGTVPNTGLTLERRHGSGIAALRLDDANPLTWQGFQSGHAGIVPGRTYRLLVRWRTDGVTGPASSGRPFGACVRFVGWPEPGETETEPLLIAHVAGDTPWHVAMAEFVAQGTALQSGEFLANPAVILENATSGAAYIDEIAVHEVLAGDALGPNVLRSPRLNSHLTFDPRRGAGLDAMLARAAERGIALRLVIGEKQDWILNRLAPDGLPDALGGHYHAPAGSAARWLHEAYWRHLRARFGAFDSLHSFELVNEDAPGMGDHFRAAAALAASAAADGHPHLASISTWATLAESAWLDGESAAISSTDFHAYVRTTGWLEPRDQLARDSARFFHEYDLDASAAGFGKPIVWGEQGIDSGTSTDDEDPRLASDDGGVWLHKMTWARSGAGGVYPLYWYTDNIERFALHRVFGAWRRFMDGVPLTNGRYEDALPVTSGPDLRAYGQKDEQDGRAHVFIDNARHTWDAVVAGRSIPPVSGSIAIDLRDAGARYLAAWIDTATGEMSRSESLVADASGVVRLTVTGLATDTAVRLARATGTGTGVDEVQGLRWSGKSQLVWTAAAGAGAYRVVQGAGESLPALASPASDSCDVWRGAATSTPDALLAVPAPGALTWYLVQGIGADGEGPAGDGAAGPRQVESAAPCS